MSALVTVDIADWHPQVAPALTERLARDLEAGNVLVLPRLAFELGPDERRFLDIRWSDGRAKNISMEAGAIKGAVGSAAERAALAALVQRFAQCAGGLITAIFPRYGPHVRQARTSFRPHRATG